MSSNLKSVRTRFYKENLVMGFLGQKSQKWARNEVFQVLRIISASNLNDFLNGITATLVLKVDLNDFFWKKSCFKVFRLKGVQNGSKMRFGCVA